MRWHITQNPTSRRISEQAAQVAQSLNIFRPIHFGNSGIGKQCMASATFHYIRRSHLRQFVDCHRMHGNCERTRSTRRHGMHTLCAHTGFDYNIIMHSNWGIRLGWSFRRSVFRFDPIHSMPKPFEIAKNSEHALHAIDSASPLCALFSISFHWDCIDVDTVDASIDAPFAGATWAWTAGGRWSAPARSAQTTNFNKMQ